MAMSKREYISQIAELMEQTNDEVMLDFVWKLMKKVVEHGKED